MTPTKEHTNRSDTSRGRGPGLFAAVLSFLVPGVGQLVQGRRRAAAAFFFAALLLYTAIFFVSIFVTEYVVPWWVQLIGIGWNFVAGIEALVHAFSTTPAGSAD